VRGVTSILLAMLCSTSLVAQEPLAHGSGSWFNLDRIGEGFVVQVLPGGNAVVTWFTYPPVGEAGSQAWMLATGTVQGDKIVLDDVVRPSGGIFGPGFDPDTVVLEDWGTLEMEFHGCNSATVTWEGPPSFGSGAMEVVRLSSIDDVACEAQVQEETGQDRIIAGRSGPWFDVSHDGEGWMIEVLPNGEMVVYWFTYDDQGNQVWMIGIARVDGRTFWVEDLLIAGGTHFGDDFVAGDVILERWGSFGFLFGDCANAAMRYRSPDERFGEGTLQPVHLAQLAATDCADPPPAVPLSGGQWRVAGELPHWNSESASAGLDGFAYHGGGVGATSVFLRFDPLEGSFDTLPGLPESRHHPMMTTDGEAIYMAGGYGGRRSVGQANFWRFDPALGFWEILPDLPQPRAAGGMAYMLERVWVVGGEGLGPRLLAFDPETETWESFSSSSAYSDHMQSVAFENEIWWMGGRSGATTDRVVIWNPVTREWREGPPMNDARSGFAARVVQGQIMVAGGERLDTFPFTLVPTVEVFAPGMDQWVLAPPLPTRVHGVTGAAVGGEFVLIGGSTDAGSFSQDRMTQIYAPAPAAD
jgi:hypothetical protein